MIITNIYSYKLIVLELFYILETLFRFDRNGGIQINMSIYLF